MKKFSVFLCTVGLVIGVAGYAIAIPVTNWNFENKAVVDGDWVSNQSGTHYDSDPIPGWGPLVNANAGTYDPNDGVENNVAYINPTTNLPDLIGQWLATPIVAGQTYDFQVDVGGPGAGSYSIAYVVRDGFNTGSVLTSIVGVSGTVSGAFITATSSLTFGSTYAGKELGIWLMNTGNTQIWFDNVVASIAPVPEPATMLLFGSGLLGLIAVGRRKFFKK